MRSRVLFGKKERSLVEIGLVRFTAFGLKGTSVKSTPATDEESEASGSKVSWRTSRARPHLGHPFRAVAPRSPRAAAAMVQAFAVCGPPASTSGPDGGVLQQDAGSAPERKSWQSHLVSCMLSCVDKPTWRRKQIYNRCSNHTKGQPLQVIAHARKTIRARVLRSQCLALCWSAVSAARVHSCKLTC